ncbi:MAG: c-type cytochrome [Saprospiraceae bacterium]|nr:c-type cytochrome [Saprospiraceae bacterium]
MKYLIFAIFSVTLLVACQSNEGAKQEEKETATTNGAAPVQSSDANTSMTVTTPEGKEHPVDSRILDQPQVREAMKKLKPQAHNTAAGGEPILIRKVNLTNPINQMMAQKGQKVHEEKCKSCHTLDAEKTQLKSLAGITRRRNPEWIMNMITGVSTTLETNAAAMQKLESCPTRQPATRLNIEQARDYLEMLRLVDSK